MTEPHVEQRWRRVVRLLRDDFVDLLCQVWQMAKTRRLLLVALMLLLVALALIIVPYDAVWLIELTKRASPRQTAWATALSLWGDYYTGSLLLAAGLMIAGLLARSTRLRRAALASLLASSLAGLGTNAVRGTIGRPRPLAEVEDGLYGPSLNFKYQGSPSAHAATSFGSAVATVVAVPALGVPVVVGALGVAWSRMYLRHHHPADVAVGGVIGAAFGLAFGLASRRGARQRPSETQRNCRGSGANPFRVSRL